MGASRKDKLGGTRQVIGGVAELVLAADPAMDRSQRVFTGTIGASAISGGLGRLIGNPSAMALGGLGYFAALTTVGS